MRTPTHVHQLELETTCIWINQRQWDNLMEGHTRANKRVIDSLVLEHLPDLYDSLALNCYNPYNYFKTSTHLILVHSSIEYFLRYN